jgi:hypothetical protein
LTNHWEAVVFANFFAADGGWLIADGCGSFETTKFISRQIGIQTIYGELFKVYALRQRIMPEETLYSLKA